MDRAVLVSSRENAFNEGHWGYLKARMVEVAVRAKRATLKDNAQIPQVRKLSEAQQSDAETFFTQMRSILPVLGVQVFRETQPLPREEESTAAEDSPVFCYVLSKRGIDARARVVGGEFVVLQGSHVTPEVTSPRRYQRIHALHSQLVADGTIRVEGDHGVLTRDITFTSPTAAGRLVTGRSCSGRTSWKWDDHGQEKTYAQWEERGLEG